MPPAKKNADSVKKRTPAKPRAKKEEYRVTVHKEEELSVQTPEPERKPARAAFNADAAFLAPEAMSFDLKLSKRAQAAQEKPLKKSRGLGRLFLYLVTLVVLIAAITAVVLALQASQQLAQNSAPAPASALSPIPSSSPTPAAAYQLGTFNVPQPVSAALSSLLATDTPNITIDTSASSAIPAGATTSLDADTLFIKTSAQPESSVILAELAKLGLQPSLSVNDGISDDFALYLVSPPASTNLSAYTATVINASGVTGAAKKYCGYLTKYQVSSCTTQNGTTQSTVALQVSYTDVAAMVQLARTPEFQGASFTQVAAGAQPTTLQVTLGK